MTLDDYLREDGSGPNLAFHVPDLVPQNGAKVRLLILLESPHRDELDAALPVVGPAGKSGLEYLLTGSTGGSLGTFVKAKHDAEDWRIAIVNVSNVPLQCKAFARRTPPSLSPADWEVLRRVRTSKAKHVNGTRCVAANQASELLFVGLQERLDLLTFDAGAAVIAAGPCAQRFARSLRKLPTRSISVYHPSYGNWMIHPSKAEHVEMRDLFTLNTEPLTPP